MGRCITRNDVARMLVCVSWSGSVIPLRMRNNSSRFLVVGTRVQKLPVHRKPVPQCKKWIVLCKCLPEHLIICVYLPESARRSSALNWRAEAKCSNTAVFVQPASIFGTSHCHGNHITIAHKYSFFVRGPVRFPGTLPVGKQLTCVIKPSVANTHSGPYTPGRAPQSRANLRPRPCPRSTTLDHGPRERMRVIAIERYRPSKCACAQLRLNAKPSPQRGGGPFFTSVSAYPRVA